VSQVPKTPIIAYTIVLGLGLTLVVLGSTSPIQPGIGAAVTAIASIIGAVLLTRIRHPGLIILIETGLGVFIVLLVVNWLHGVSPITTLKWYYRALVELFTPLASLTPRHLP